MNAPLYKYNLFDFDMSLLVALIIGIGFGFFLEKGGLGNARKLADQFYLKDMTVFKVMFSAIITAMLGLFWLSWLGYLDLSLVYINPTYILPQLVGGLLFGIGFVMGGLCPGTSCVAIATGKLDGIAVLIGILLGIFLFGEVFIYINDFLYSTSLGQITLPDYLNLSYGILIFIIVFLAIGGFIGAEKIEKRYSNR